MEKNLDSESKSMSGRGSIFSSLKGKGYLFIVSLLIYGAVLTSFGFQQKELLIKNFLGAHVTFIEQWRSKMTDMVAIHGMMETYMDVYKGYKSGDPNMTGHHLTDHLRSLNKKLHELEGHFPKDTNSFIDIEKSMAASIGSTTERNLDVLLEKFKEVNVVISRSVGEQQHFLNELVNQFNTKSDRVTIKVTIIGLMGMIVSMFFVGHFFTAIDRDLEHLIERSREIVKGERINQEEYPAERRLDKVGELTYALKRMAAELDNQERQLGIERKKIFHQDKMAAIGTLAAGIAHEVGNPIAAISALADETRKSVMAKENMCKNKKCFLNMDLIITHTERLARITREISEFSTPQPSKLQWLDVNNLVRNTARLMRYDRRYRQVDLQLNLDTQLPAIKAKGDQVSQVLMNLLINAADASANIKGRSPTTTCATTAKNGSVFISITDNGHGMNQEALDRAFEAFYTTKPAGKGTGLGLSLCHSIIAEHGGKIDISSEPDAGTTVRITLPVEGPLEFREKV